MPPSFLLFETGFAREKAIYAAKTIFGIPSPFVCWPCTGLIRWFGLLIGWRAEISNLPAMGGSSVL